MTVPAVQTLGPADASILCVMAPGDHGETHDVVPCCVAGVFAAAGIRVVWFADPHPRTADRDRCLDATLQDVIAQHHRGQALVVGGVSRGARAALGLSRTVPRVLWSYPFHPRGQTDATAAKRAFSACDSPVWLGQGTRDALGNREQVRGYGLPDPVVIHWLEDANHGLVPRQRSGQTQEQGVTEAAMKAARFIHAVAAVSSS